jgi:hypothetical protein
VKFLLLFAFVISTFLVGCASTVKRDPIPVLSVHFYEIRNGSVGTESGVIPVRSVTKNCQYVGQVRWSGFMPEYDIPEAAVLQPILSDIPDRVKIELREKAGAMGANLVLYDGWYWQRWEMHDQKFQPYFTIGAKAYFFPTSVSNN